MAGRLHFVSGPPQGVSWAALVTVNARRALACLVGEYVTPSTTSYRDPDLGIVIAYPS
jgi:hypothetical protein